MSNKFNGILSTSDIYLGARDRIIITYIITTMLWNCISCCSHCRRYYEDYLICIIFHVVPWPAWVGYQTGMVCTQIIIPTAGILAWVITYLMLV